MKVIRVSEGDSYELEPGWKRVSLAGSVNISVEYFSKPAYHTTPLHTHPSEQVSIVLKGRMTVVGGDGEEAELAPGDSAWFAPDEPHRIANAGEDVAVGVDIFVPARDFAFWKNRPRT